MAKAGMRRPSPKQPHGTESNHITHIPKNIVPPVPEIQGKAKHGKKKANTKIFDEADNPKHSASISQHNQNRIHNAKKKH